MVHIPSGVERGVRDSSVFSCFVLPLFVFLSKHFYLNLIHLIKQAKKVNQLKEMPLFDHCFNFAQSGLFM